MCTTRALQRISWVEFPVTSAGMRSVASMGVPTCSGADEAKKNPPRDTFRASVKCSVLSAATPRARKRRGVRRLRRAIWRRSDTFILPFTGEKSSDADSQFWLKVITSVAESYARSSTKPGMAKRYQYTLEIIAVSNHALMKPERTYHNASLTHAKNAVNVGTRQASPSPE